MARRRSSKRHRRGFLSSLSAETIVAQGKRGSRHTAHVTRAAIRAARNVAPIPRRSKIARALRRIIP